MRLREWLGIAKTPRYEDARWLGPILFTAICLIGGSLLVLVLVGTFGALLRAEGELRDYLYFLVALIGLPFLFWRTSVAQHQARTSEQGLITDRFTKAVEQLGAEKTVKEDGTERTIPNLEVRLGGIYALERLAFDSIADATPIIKVLSSYVRLNAPVNTAEKAPHLLWQEAAAGSDGVQGMDAHEIHAQLGLHPDCLKEFEIRGWYDAQPDPRVDIQTVLDALSRMIEAGLNEGKINLRNANLRKADFKRGNFTNIDFSGSALEGADLRFADFSDTIFLVADLTCAKAGLANFKRAEIFRTSFSYADLNSSKFNDAELALCPFESTLVHGADFSTKQLLRRDEDPFSPIGTATGLH